jgi:hypothetical protein
MTYIDRFRNSLIVDILEWTGFVTLDPNFSPQVAQAANENSGTISRASIDSQLEDIEKKADSAGVAETCLVLQMKQQ